MASSADQEMSKRVNVYLPDETAEKLEEWAKNQGHSLSSLAAFLVERAVEAALVKGDFPLTNPATICKQAAKE